MAVVDASVVVSTLNTDEASHGISQAWWEATLRNGQVLHAPAILLPEAAAGVARFLVDPPLAASYVSRLIVAAHVTLWPVPETLALRAAEIVGTHRIRGCDAVYVALAEQLGEPLVTLDDEQLARGGSLVVTLRPGEPTDPPGSRPG